MMMNKTGLLSVAFVLMMAGGAEAHSIDDGGDPGSYQTSVWVVDLAQMRATIDSGRPIDLPFADLGKQSALVTEFSIFAPGQKLKAVVGEDGAMLGYEPFDYWSYSGVLQGAAASAPSPGFIADRDTQPVVDSEVLITMDDRGLYGHVRAYGTMTWYEPVDEDHVLAPGEPARVLVKWRGVAEGAPAASDVQEAVSDAKATLRDVDVNDLADSEDHSFTTTGTYKGGKAVKCSVNEIGIVQPVADTRFATKHSNFNTRISNAFSAQREMWFYQTCIQMYMNSVAYANRNYSGSADCNTHLNDFVGSYTPPSGVDASQLFTGKDLDDCNGIGRRPATSGNLATRRYSVVEAVDHSYWDTYDPDETTSDLGLVSGHEIAHNWGERDHPDDHYNKNGRKNFNIMASGTDYDMRGFWFTSGSSSKSANRILRATQGHFN